MPARVPARRARLAPVEGVWCCVDDDVSAIRHPRPASRLRLRCDRVFSTKLVYTAVRM